MRQFLSIMVVAFGLCSPAFAGQDLDALQAKAEQGDANAQYNLGVMHAKGVGTLHEVAEAVKWYRKAAEQGDAQAQYTLGVEYDKGQGVPRDYAEAVKWYRKAAEQGDARAQFNLGAMYDQGEGVPRDYVTAYMWISLAAAQGNEVAQNNLDMIASDLTAGQRADAQRMARDWRLNPAAKQ